MCQSYTGHVDELWFLPVRSLRLNTNDDNDDDDVYMVVFLFKTVIYVSSFLYLCILVVCLCIFIVPAGTLRLPSLRFSRAFSSAVRQMPG